MSHYNAIKTQIKDPGLIIDALKAMGLDGVYHDQPAPMRGWYNTRSEAHIVVPGHSDDSYLSYDLGFRRGDDDTYSLVIEDLDASDYRYARGRKFHSDFMLQYGLAAVRQSMPGMVISYEQTMSDGSIRYQFEVETTAEVAQSISIGV